MLWIKWKAAKNHFSWFPTSPIKARVQPASSGDNAPRGIDFLLEPNRLNVAISRAQCLSIIIGSPRLATGLINTVDEAEKVNRLCRLMIGKISY